MESRVMGNCHARFGAGENPEERICSLRLHIPPKGLPIAILRDGSRRHGDEASGPLHQVADRGAKSHHGTVGGGMAPALSFCQYPGSDKERF